MIRRRTDITLSVVIFWFSVIGRLSISAQTAESSPYTFTILPGLQSQSVPLLSPGMVALLALLLAAAGTYILRNSGGT